MYGLILMQDGQKLDISQLAGGLAWTSNIDTLGEELTFSYAFDVSSIVSIPELREGNIIIRFKDSVILHYYVIVSIQADGRYAKSVTCYDFGWYLNKNDAVIQFNRISVSEAIRKLCDKFGIKHNIVNIPTLVTKIYKDMAVSDIIKDLLELATQETRKKYVMEMVVDTLTISNQSDMLINPMVDIGGVIVPATSLISSPSRKTSIDELRNNIIVVSDEESSTKIYATASDEESIRRYGQLTDVVTVDNKNAAQARNIARNTLAEQNKVQQECSIELPGHDDIKAGRLIDINEPITGIIGRYLITSAAHSLSKDIHKVSVELEAV